MCLNKPGFTKGVVVRWVALNTAATVGFPETKVRKLRKEYFFSFWKTTFFKGYINICCKAVKLFLEKKVQVHLHTSTGVKGNSRAGLICFGFLCFYFGLATF